MEITRRDHPTFPFLVTHSVEAGNVRQVARFAEERDAEIYVARTDLLNVVALCNPLILQEVDRRVGDIIKQRDELVPIAARQEAEIAAEAQRRADAAIEAFLQLPLEQLERQVITAAMTRHGGHRETVAKALGIGVRTLHDKLKSYGWGPRQKAA